MVCFSINKYFKHIPEHAIIRKSNKPNKPFNIDYVPDEVNNNFNSTSVGSARKQVLYDYTIYKGVLIKCSFVYIDNDQNYNNDVSFQVIRSERNIKILKEFISKLIHEGAELSIKRKLESAVIANAHNSNSVTARSKIINKRSFDNVFVTDEIENKIKSSITNFINSRDWFSEHNVPHHFGILLYGSPGMGKTSLANAIASYFNMPLSMVSGDLLTNLPMLLTNANIIPDICGAVDQYRVLLVEDIDCGIDFGGTLYSRSTTREYNDDKNNNGLASILNCLDGVDAQENVIYIFTTNHIEKLDPALIRPGRIDLKIEIPPVNIEIFNKFCKSFYGDDIVPLDEDDEDIKIVDGLSCAELQINVMNGMTYPELCNFAIIKKEKMKICN